MEKLFRGITKFQLEDFEAHRDLFKKLGRTQQPHTLFIGCSDSRVVPNLITKTHPGELFTVRNIANIVPPYRITEEYVATTSAVEYAVQVLNVDTIVVCGHSNCGGCAALNAPADSLEHIPHVRKWLEASDEVKGRVDNLITSDSPEEREWLTEQINILVQMKNLLTYPYVQERFKDGKLNIFGWYYIIETGEIYNFNDENACFELIS
ncbi:MAG: carbonic anhydrase [Desulfuromonas sp.]|uniref:carbonic anhydrase n=1 Tax=Desulfuromonas sp. TaxID=892 RepID=UPI000CA863F4|nr:carbonic anhydrase [Desulfuromonas sp.]PLX84931.1 MAG: carbonic anhydrase [Desulfuromonas sp.]